MRIFIHEMKEKTRKSHPQVQTQTRTTKKSFKKKKKEIEKEICISNVKSVRITQFTLCEQTYKRKKGCIELYQMVLYRMYHYSFTANAKERPSIKDLYFLENKELPLTVNKIQKPAPSLSRKCMTNQALSNSEAHAMNKAHQDQQMGMTSILMTQSVDMKWLQQKGSHPLVDCRKHICNVSYNTIKPKNTT